MTYKKQTFQTKNYVWRNKGLSLPQGIGNKQGIFKILQFHYFEKVFKHNTKTGPETDTTIELRIEK